MQVIEVTLPTHGQCPCVGERLASLLAEGG